MRKLKTKNPHKTLYFRVQRALATVSDGMDTCTFRDVWRVMYPVLLEVHSDLAWAISLQFKNTDRYANGKSSLSIIIRFKDGESFKDCTLLMSTRDILIYNSFDLNSTDFNTIYEWMAAVQNNKNLKALASKVLWKRILNYTKD